MFNEMYKEIVVAGILVTAAVLILNPTQMTMSDSIAMALEVAFVAAVAFFIGVLWRERGGDERNQFHRMLADRVGFLAGLIVLTVFILVQTIRHDLDEWLVVALIVMVLAKLIALIYGQLKH